MEIKICENFKMIAFAINDMNTINKENFPGKTGNSKSCSIISIPHLPLAPSFEITKLTNHISSSCIKSSTAILFQISNVTNIDRKVFKNIPPLLAIPWLNSMIKIYWYQGKGRIIITVSRRITFSRKYIASWAPTSTRLFCWRTSMKFFLMQPHWNLIINFSHNLLLS